MNDLADTPLTEVHFEHPRLSRLGVEVMTLAELRKSARPDLLAMPQRVHFHHVVFMQRGRAGHMVDFVEHELRAGTVLVVRAGQVQQWRLGDEAEGMLALASAEALAPTVIGSNSDSSLLALESWPAASSPPEDSFAEGVADMRRLRADVDRYEGQPIEAAIVRHELMAMLLRLARSQHELHPTSAPTREAAIHALFRKELETGYARRLTVLDYADRLGYSESTLSRACVATVGRTAKQEVDARIALEAKRLLVHSQASAAGIGHQLGFTEATNFLKFFRRQVGCTPVEFRARQLGDVASAVGAGRH